MFERFDGFDRRKRLAYRSAKTWQKKYNSVERELFSGNAVVHGPFENLLTNFAQARILAVNRDTVVPNSIDGRNNFFPFFFFFFPPYNSLVERISQIMFRMRLENWGEKLKKKGRGRQ